MWQPFPACLCHVLRKERALREPEIHRRLALARAKLAANKASRHVKAGIGQTCDCESHDCEGAKEDDVRVGRQCRTAALASDVEDDN